MPELYEFQKQAVADLQKPEKHIVVAPCGCFTGDTKVRINLAGNGKQCTIKHLYLSWNGLHNHKEHHIQEPQKAYIRGWRNGRVGLNKIKDVKCLGKKTILRLEFSDGTVIRSTPDHLFMGYFTRSHNKCEPDWIPADELLGCFVAKDNPHTKHLKGGSQAKRKGDTRITVPVTHPYARPVPDGNYKVMEFHRAIYEAKLNGFDDVYDWREHIGVTPMQFIDPKLYHIHHKDHNHFNNDPDNLEALTIAEHQQHHINPQNFHQGEVEYVKCVEIEECGEETVYDVVCEDVHSYTANDFVVHNCGKSAIALSWALTTPNQKWLVITTPAARDSRQWYDELNLWCKDSLSSISLEVISWAGLAKWTVANWNSLDEYTFIFDEVKRAAAGVSSAQGRAFIQITKRSNTWAGFSATPGDRWIDFQAYFIAGGYIKNKTQFMREFCEVQTYKGFPEIVAYRDEEILQRYWRRLALFPDVSKMLAELPPERHYTHRFKADAEYKRLMKTRTLKDGTFLDTAGAFAAACRRASFGQAKQKWLADFLQDLGESCCIFYALTETGDKIEEIAKKSLPKDTPILRVYGKSHPVVTAETVGKRGVVICQWQAGSEALNLQFMRQWVGAEMCYAYWQAQQGRGRIQRKGQTADYVVYHYLKSPGTIDDNVYAALKEKSEFSEGTWFEGLNNKKGE